MNVIKILMYSRGTSKSKLFAVKQLRWRGQIDWMEFPIEQWEQSKIHRIKWSRLMKLFCFGAKPIQNEDKKYINIIFKLIWKFWRDFSFRQRTVDR